MSNIETVFLASRSPEMTKNIGFSLASTLYPHGGVWPLILLMGELGSGKTTFTKGLGVGLGLGNNVVTSPTYALEHRYGETLLHLDLFRLKSEEAQKLLLASEDFPGVRVVEWSDHGENRDPHIIVSLSERSETERRIEVVFQDLTWPPRTQIEEWRAAVQLPSHIALHCDAVGTFAVRCAEILLRQGHIVRPQTLRAAGELHDLLRFVDFQERERGEQKIWQELRQKYEGRHEEVCASFLEEQGFHALATIVRPHGLLGIDDVRTTEQKVLFYADKRILGEQPVSLTERFDDFVERYGGGIESAEAQRWRERTIALERELFADTLP
jgi:tRNA threonylcarbamoyladenosine biosynthesis protein TsaE